MVVCGNIVKKLVLGLYKSFCAFCLVGGDDTKGSSKCGVNGVCIVENCFHDILDVFDEL